MKHNPGFLALVDDAKSRVKQVDIDQYKTMPRKGHILIDTREDTEWEKGHAEGAIHLSKGIIERDIETFAPNKSSDLILYCGGGYRAALAADSLQLMGYNNVRSMAGGWRAWIDAGNPIEESQ